MDGEFGSVSSAHYSSPSQTLISGQGQGNTSANTTGAGTTKTSATLRRKVGSGSGSTSRDRDRERQSSVDGGNGNGSGKNSLSPMNPRRAHGSGALMSPGVSIGGAVASMNSSAGLGSIRPGSPPSSNLAARRRLLGGIRKSAGQNT